MTRLRSKALVAVLALALVGAQAVCACLSPGAAERACHAVGRVEVADTPAPADPHACCKHGSDDPSDPSPSPAPAVPAGDPCGHCNLLHPAQRVAPEEPAKAVSPFDRAGIALASADFLPAQRPVLAPVSARLADDVPIPPLLRDLFHCHCLLTI